MFIRKTVVLVATATALTVGCNEETSTTAKKTQPKAPAVPAQAPSNHGHGHGIQVDGFGSITVGGVTFNVKKASDNSHFKLINNPAKKYEIRGYVVNSKGEESLQSKAGYCSGHKEHDLAIKELPTVDVGSKVIFEIKVNDKTYTREMKLK